MNITSEQVKALANDELLKRVSTLTQLVLKLTTDGVPLTEEDLAYVDMLKRRFGHIVGVSS